MNSSGGIKLAGDERFTNRQVKLHLHLFIAVGKLTQANTRFIERCLEDSRDPLGQHRFPLRFKAAEFQFFLYPVRVNRLGKIEVFKQTVQECPR